jgi:hypothetical protein
VVVEELALKIGRCVAFATRMTRDQDSPGLSARPSAIDTAREACRAPGQLRHRVMTSVSSSRVTPPAQGGVTHGNTLLQTFALACDVDGGTRGLRDTDPSVRLEHIAHRQLRRVVMDPGLVSRALQLCPGDMEFRQVRLEHLESELDRGRA